MPRRPINSCGSELLNQIEAMIEDELRHGTDQLGRRVTKDGVQAKAKCQRHSREGVHP